MLTAARWGWDAPCALGRLPSLVHGVHGLLAYGVFVSYLMTIYQPGVNFGPTWSDTPTLCVVLFAVLLGGMTTGHRGFSEPIWSLLWLRRAPQVVMIIHLFAALMAVAALGAQCRITRWRSIWPSPR